MLHPSLLVPEIDKEVQLGPTPYLPAIEWGSHPSNEKMEVSRQIYDQGLVTNWTRTNTFRMNKRNPANFRYSIASTIYIIKVLIDLKAHLATFRFRSRSRS
jgi:hypothetical protein